MSNVNGLNDVISRLNRLSANLQREVKEIVAFNIGEIETAAIRDAPGPGDVIRVQGGSIEQDRISSRRRGQTPISQGIGSKEYNNGYSGSVFVEASVGDIAAYVEFGTGQSAASYLATVDPDWRATARRFFVDGKGKIINQPYLYPAYLRQRIIFVNELKRALKDVKI